MPIFSIDAESCVNCGKCVKICPLDVLREGKTTPEIVYREDCQSCFLCIIYWDGLRPSLTKKTEGGGRVRGPLP